MLSGRIMNNPLRLAVFSLLPVVSSLPAATHYVSLGSTSPMPPYTSWVTAASTIQDAVDAAAGGDVVVVTNGVYAVGGREAFNWYGDSMGLNRVAITNALALRSENGPLLTVIDGAGAYRCVSLTAGASLTGFTLTNGVDTHYGMGGAGVWCASTNAFLTNCMLAGNSSRGPFAAGGGAYGGTLYNCTLAGNSATNGGFGGGADSCALYNCMLIGNSCYYGGGAYSSTLYNCTLAGNSGNWGGGAYECTLYNCTLTGNSGPLCYGGGAAGSTLYNCTLAGNSAYYGGGAYGSIVHNCIIYFNADTNGANFDLTSTLSYCCTTPHPAGSGNITNTPLFIDYASGNLRLQSNSPCINAGNNALVNTATDLDGRARVVSGRVDMGAYEFQPGLSGAFLGWLQRYGLPTDGSADYADSDHDGMNNWLEWACGTDPTNPLSVLRLLPPAITSTTTTVTWQSVAGVNYSLGRSSNLTSSFTVLATHIVGQAGATSYIDTNAAGARAFFYRVGVSPP